MPREMDIRKFNINIVNVKLCADYTGYERNNSHCGHINQSLKTLAYYCRLLYLTSALKKITGQNSKFRVLKTP